MRFRLQVSGINSDAVGDHQQAVRVAGNPRPCLRTRQKRWQWLLAQHVLAGPRRRGWCYSRCMLLGKGPSVNNGFDLSVVGDAGQRVSVSVRMEDIGEYVQSGVSWFAPLVSGWPVTRAVILAVCDLAQACMKRSEIVPRPMAAYPDRPAAGVCARTKAGGLRPRPWRKKAAEAAATS